MNVDISKMKRVGGTTAGGYYEIEHDVLLAYPPDGYIQTEAGARVSLLEQHRIARQRGRRHVTVVLVDRVHSQDKGSRRVWTNEADPDLMCGLALVASSLLARAIASFFVGLTRPRVPTRMFASYEEAVAWAREVAAMQGGAIEA